jgi:hypothetical protein
MPPSTPRASGDRSALCIILCAAGLTAAASAQTGGPSSSERPTGLRTPAPEGRANKGEATTKENPGADLRPTTPAPTAPAPWGRPAAQVPDELAKAPYPLFYVYDGRPVELGLDVRRVAVRLAAALPEGAAVGLAKLSGVACDAETQTGLPEWRLLTLTAPAQDAAGIDFVLSALLALPEVAFASPVFHNDAGPEGWTTVQPWVLARVQPERLAGGDALVAARAKDLPVVETTLAGLPGAYRLSAPSRNGFDVLRAARRLARDADFAWAEPDFLLTGTKAAIPNDPLFSQQWGIRNLGAGSPGSTGWDIDTNAELTWDVSRGDPAVKVLVMDDGTQVGHPDLNVVPGRDFTNGQAAGFGDGSPQVACDNHGTAVAGIIASRFNNGLGAAGVAPNCPVVPARIGISTSDCASTAFTSSYSWVANALAWGAGQGARVSNASFTLEPAASVLTDAYANARAGGMVHFASAGNDGTAVVHNPAGLPSVCSVGAINSDGSRASFSNFNAAVRYAMPGSGCPSADRTGSAGYAAGDTTFFSGTSCASPFAAGAAALVWSVLPHLTADQLLARLDATCKDRGPVGRDNEYGFGLIDTWAAINVFPNDFLITAREITGTSWTSGPVATAAATATPVEPQATCERGDAGESRSVWFTFVAPGYGQVTLSTAGSSYDTVLSAWQGVLTDGVWDYVQLACDDDSGPAGTSVIDRLPVQAGFRYWVKASAWGASGAGGTLNLSYSYSSTGFDFPANDLCLSSTTTRFNLPAGGGSRTDYIGGSGLDGSGSCGGALDVWYTYVAPSDGTLLVDTCGTKGLSGLDTTLSVRTGCPSTSGTVELAANNEPWFDTCGGRDAGVRRDASLTVALRAGQSVAIRVGIDRSSRSGGLMVTLNHSFLPAQPSGNPVYNPVTREVYRLLGPSSAEVARATARAAGGYLVTVDSALENQWIATHVAGPRNAGAWTGLSDAGAEGTWAWDNPLSGGAAYRNWQPGEPNNAGCNEDRAVVFGNGLWADWPDQPAPPTAALVESVGVSKGPLVNPATGKIYYRLQPASWTASRARARAMGGDLASISSVAENSWVNANMSAVGSGPLAFNVNLWLGLNHASIEGTFAWPDGSPSSYRNWAPGEPGNAADKDYVSMRGDGTWNVLANDPSVSTYGLVQVSPPATGPVSRPGTTSRYYLLPPMTWEGAMFQSARLGGELASVYDAAENEWVRATFTSGDDVWIGLSDGLYEEVFRWPDGSFPGYQNWAAGQPDNAGGLEHYVALRADGRWNDLRSDPMEYGGAPLRGVVKVYARSDFNRNNQVDLLDIFAFLNAWFSGCTGPQMPGTGCSRSADHNGVNGVDLLDIFAFLQDWFAGA